MSETQNLNEATLSSCLLQHDGWYSALPIIIIIRVSHRAKRFLDTQFIIRNALRLVPTKIYNKTEEREEGEREKKEREIRREEETEEEKKRVLESGSE